MTRVLSFGSTVLSLLLTACSGSDALLSHSLAPGMPPSDSRAEDGTPAPLTSDSLAACLLEADPAQCGTALARLPGLAACPPNESDGLNCVFNTIYDAVGVDVLADAASAALSACGASPAAPICALLRSPEPLPGVLPLLNAPLERGGLVVEAETFEPGDGETWQGRPSRIGGTAHYDRGEHLYNDYVFDAWGADDGDDARRLAVSLLLGRAVEATERLDQLFQAVGSQFGLPRPVGAEEHYGDAFALDDGTDLLELRWATRPATLRFKARLVRLLDPANLQLVILADTREGGGMRGLDIGIGTERFDRAVRIDAERAVVIDLLDGRAEPLSTPVRVDLAAKTIEVELPRALLTHPDGDLVTTVASLGNLAAEGESPIWRIANVGYRFDEPVAGLYNERGQALSLFAGTVDRYAHRIDLAALDAGLSQRVRPGPGYHERQFDSGDNISDPASREDGPVQHYGLYVPPAFQPGQPTPLAIWLHYRGGKAHNGGAWTPGLIRTYGDRHGQIVVTPRGRGTSTWYVSRAHQDFFEVFDDVHALFPEIDPRRRYLSGYSMGGYGTYLFGLLYPELFAAGYSTAGALTQGAWTGVGPDLPGCRNDPVPIPGLGDGNLCFIQANDGDADAQLTWRLLENARHLPLAIHHGTTDYLVPITGILRVGERLTELGYRHDLLTFIGYEHFTQAIMDEWRDGADYLAGFVAPENPRQVTYRIHPALVRAVNTIRHDGPPFTFNPNRAWWVSGLKLRDADPTDPENFGRIDAVSEALPAQMILPLPRTGLTQGSTPVLAPLGHSTPFLRTGLDWLPLGAAPLANRFLVTAENLAEAALDLGRMALDIASGAEGVIETDGALNVRFHGIASDFRVQLNDHDAAFCSRECEIGLPAGRHTLRLSQNNGR